MSFILRIFIFNPSLAQGMLSLNLCQQAVFNYFAKLRVAKGKQV